MNVISDKIASGARSFLMTEYKFLSVYIVVVASLLLALYTLKPPSDDRLDGARYSIAFLLGATLSAYAGWGGMRVATDANVRTAQAAKESGLSVALNVAFTGGSVMGFTVVGYALLGLSCLFVLLTLGYNGNTSETTRFIYAGEALAGFGLGSSSIALFARVAGGIYTKAADIGADLVGKSKNMYLHACCYRCDLCYSTGSSVVRRNMKHLQMALPTNTHTHIYTHTNALALSLAHTCMNVLYFSQHRQSGDGDSRRRPTEPRCDCRQCW